MNQNLWILKHLESPEIIFVAVPTPMNKDGSANLDIVRAVCEEIQEIDDTKYIVLRSTDYLQQAGRT